MKVLMVAPSVRVPDTLGQTLHQLALANGLAKRGIQITLLCRYDSNQLNKEFDSNLKFLSINDPKIPFERLIFTYNSYKSAVKELKNNDYDLVHDRGYIFAGSGVRAANECGVKSILQVDDNWIRSERSATKFAKYWLYNKKAIVCGSTQGIGEASAIELAKLGANITLVARNKDKLLEVLNRLDTSKGQSHSFICVDFSNTEKLKSELDLLNNTYHVLVNNTGGPPSGSIIDASVKSFEDAFKMHLVNNQLLVQKFIEGMKRYI